MKKMMKFAAMAVAALAMLVSCDNKEKTPVTIDGKQWVFEMWYNKVDGTDIYSPAVLDLGVQQEGMLILGQAKPNTTAYEMNFEPSAYTIEKIDETSGIIKFECYGLEDEYQYSNLTENSVIISGGIFEIDDNTKATVSAVKLVIAE